MQKLETVPDLFLLLVTSDLRFQSADFVHDMASQTLVERIDDTCTVECSTSIQPKVQVEL